jgi:hypothetical protein
VSVGDPLESIRLWLCHEHPQQVRDREQWRPHPEKERRIPIYAKRAELELPMFDPPVMEDLGV